jgi:hypothetical protein
MRKKHDESVIKAAFDALRDPASDPGGFGKGFCLTTVPVNGQDRWVIAATVNDVLVPLFFALVPGDRVKVNGIDRIVGPGLNWR